MHHVHGLLQLAVAGECAAQEGRLGQIAAEDGVLQGGLEVVLHESGEGGREAHSLRRRTEQGTKQAGSVPPPFFLERTDESTPHGKCSYLVLDEVSPDLGVEALPQDLQLL